MRRPERGVAPRPRVVADDQTAWLTTFSDLVLQLFGFLVLGVVVTRATPPAAPVSPPASAIEEAVAAPAEPPPAAALRSDGGLDAAEIRRAVALVDDAVARSAWTAAAAAPEGPADDAAPAPAAPAPATVTASTTLDATRATHADDAGARIPAGDSGVVFTLDGGIAFASGSADLLPGAAPVLAEIRRLAASLPDVTIDVAGHTDDVPIHTSAFPSNLALSQARAERVAQAIAAGDPALAARTVARGWGDTRPIASNDDPAGRARNRRVEIRLVPAGAD